MKNTFGVQAMNETPEQRAAWEKELKGVLGPDPKDAATWPDPEIRRIVAEIREKHPDESSSGDNFLQVQAPASKVTINDHLTTDWRDIAALLLLIAILSFAYWVSEHAHLLWRISLLAVVFAR